LLGPPNAQSSGEGAGVDVSGGEGRTNFRWRHGSFRCASSASRSSFRQAQALGNSPPKRARKSFTAAWPAWCVGASRIASRCALGLWSLVWKKRGWPGDEANVVAPEFAFGSFSPKCLSADGRHCVFVWFRPDAWNSVACRFETSP
jgi:hypothetical protein